MVNFLREKLYDMCSFWEEIYAAISNGNLIPEFFIKAVKLSVTASLLILVVLALKWYFVKRQDGFIACFGDWLRCGWFVRFLWRAASH